MSEKGSEADIRPRRFNVADVPQADVSALARLEISGEAPARSTANLNLGAYGEPRRLLSSAPFQSSSGECRLDFVEKELRDNCGQLMAWTPWRGCEAAALCIVAKLS